MLTLLIEIKNVLTKVLINLRSVFSASPGLNRADSTVSYGANKKIYLSKTNRQTYG